MFTVEYYWEMRFDTEEEAEAFAISVGPIYGEIPWVVPIDKKE